MKPDDITQITQIIAQNIRSILKKSKQAWQLGCRYLVSVLCLPLLLVGVITSFSASAIASPIQTSIQTLSQTPIQVSYSRLAHQDRSMGDRLNSELLISANSGGGYYSRTRSAHRARRHERDFSANNLRKISRTSKQNSKQNLKQAMGRDAAQEAKNQTRESMKRAAGSTQRSLDQSKINQAGTKAKQAIERPVN